MTERIQRIVSTTAIYIIRKFFGFILLAMAARMFTVNLTQLIHQSFAQNLSHESSVKNF